MNDSKLKHLFERLDQSSFRKGVKLNAKDNVYLQSKGKLIVALHAAEFIKNRLAPAYPINDGKQTPWKGHPVFVAQHATATCCRNCLQKWHHIPQGRLLNEQEQQYIITVIMHWLNLGKAHSRKDTSRHLSLL